jgi:uncharacterized protein (DUF1330 family)
VIVVAIMTVHRAGLERFRAFERAAVAIMRDHGGALARTVVADASPDAPTLREIHIVRFPDAAAYAAYRADPRLAALADERAATVAATEIIIGHDGPLY